MCPPLVAAGDTTDLVDNIVAQVDQHWRDNNALLGDTKQKVTTSVALKEFYDQLATLQQIVDGYERFICNEGRVSDEAMEIFRQLEQCRVSFIFYLDKLNEYLILTYSTQFF